MMRKLSKHSLLCLCLVLLTSFTMTSVAWATPTTVEKDISTLSNEKVSIQKVYELADKYGCIFTPTTPDKEICIETYKEMEAKMKEYREYLDYTKKYPAIVDLKAKTITRNGKIVGTVMETPISNVSIAEHKPPFRPSIHANMPQVAPDVVTRYTLKEWEAVSFQYRTFIIDAYVESPKLTGLTIVSTGYTGVGLWHWEEVRSGVSNWFWMPVIGGSDYVYGAEVFAEGWSVAGYEPGVVSFFNTWYNSFTVS